MECSRATGRTEVKDIVFPEKSFSLEALLWQNKHMHNKGNWRLIALKKSTALPVVAFGRPL